MGGADREGAIWFCVSEALTHPAKHGAARVRITIANRDGSLTFTVADSGPGFDSAAVHRGSGLNNMTDRLDALDRTITIDSKSSCGSLRPT